MEQPISLIPVKELRVVSPFHTMTISHVTIDVRDKSGDYHLIDGKPVLSKTALMRVASAAGIIWNWKDSGIVSISSDYVCYKAVAGVRLTDGTIQPVMGTKEIDLKVIEEETYQKNLKKKDCSDPRGETARAMIQWRKNKVARAETGAMLRCVRAVLGMKSSYTMNELAAGFSVPCIQFTPDFNSPQVQQMLMNGAYGFGGSQPTISAPGNLPALQAPADEEEVIEASVVNHTVPAQLQAPAASQSRHTAEVVSHLAADNSQDSATVTPPPAVQQPSQPPAAQNEGKPFCRKCKVSISEGVANYSIANHGEELCFHCQQKAKAGAAA